MGLHLKPSAPRARVLIDTEHAIIRIKLKVGSASEDNGREAATEAIEDYEKLAWSVHSAHAGRCAHIPAQAQAIMLRSRWGPETLSQAFTRRTPSPPPTLSLPAPLVGGPSLPGVHKPTGLAVSGPPSWNL